MFVVEQGVGGDDEFPLAVPDAAADEAAVGELAGQAAVEVGRVVHRAEGLVFTGDPELLVHRALRGEELGGGEIVLAEVEGQGHGLVFYRPVAGDGGVAEGRGEHGIHAGGDQVNVGGGAEGVGVGAGGAAGVGGADGVGVHADVALEDDAGRVDLGGEVGGGVGVVAGGEGQAEEVEAVADGGAEGDDDAGDEAAVGFAEIAAILGDVGVVEQVAHEVLFQDLAPGGVVVGGGGVGADAEEFLAEREEGAVLVGVVDAEAGLDRGPIAEEAGEQAGEAAVAGGAGAGDGEVVLEVAEGAGGDDAVDKGAAGGGAEQAGLVVVTLDGEVGVLGGEVVEGLVLGELFVAEGAVEHVAGAVALDDGGGADAEDFAFGEDAVGLGDELGNAFVGALEFGEAAGELEAGAEHVVEELFKFDDVLFVLVVPFVGAKGVVGVGGELVGFELEVGGLGFEGEAGEDLRVRCDGTAVNAETTGYGGGVDGEAGDGGEGLGGGFGDGGGEFGVGAQEGAAGGVGGGGLEVVSGFGEGGVGVVVRALVGGAEFGEELVVAVEAAHEAVEGVGGFAGVDLGLVNVEQGGLDLAGLGAGAHVGAGELHETVGRNLAGAGGVLERVLDAVVNVVERPGGERIEVEGFAVVDCDLGGGIHKVGRFIDEEVMVEVGVGVALGVEFAGADVAGVGGAEEVEELVFVGVFLVVHGVVVVVEGVVLGAQEAVHGAGLVEGGLGVLAGSEGAFVDLLEVGFAGFELGGGDVEGDGPFGETEGVEVGALGVEGGLDVERAGDDLAEFGHGGAVDDLDAGVG